MDNIGLNVTIIRLPPKPQFPKLVEQLIHACHTFRQLKNKPSTKAEAERFLHCHTLIEGLYQTWSCQADTISALREEYRLLTLECNAVKHSRNTYMHQAAEAITQCKINQRTIAKLNKTVEVLQKELATLKTPSQGY